MKPSIGRIVHVNIGTSEAPAWRAALVTAVFGDLANVTIFLDGHNDQPGSASLCGLPPGIDRIDLLHARGYSRSAGEGEGCWRWPPRE